MIRSDLQMSLQVQAPSPQSSPKGEEDTGRGCLGNRGGKQYAKRQVREDSKAVWIYEVLLLHPIRE